VTRPPSTILERILVVLAIAVAGLWAYRLATGPPTGLWLVAKASFAPLLALAAFSRRDAADHALLGVALLAHGAGDLLLEVRFVAGVVAFLVGQLLYVALFWRRRRPVEEIGGGARIGAGAVALVGALFLGLLAPRLAGALAVAIPVYAVSLLAMATTALWSGRGQPWVGLGGLLFVASDALLSMELFLGGMTPGRLLVWPLYALAQLAIVLGWLRPVAAPRAGLAL